MARSDQHALATFNTLAEIRFPEEVLTKGEENVLVHDTGSDDESRVLVFSNNSLLEILNEATILQMDGTFRICPNLFHQLYTIHCWFRGRCVPVIYALLPSATSETYGKLFEFLALHVRNRAPIVVMDMELAAKNAFTTKFANANIKYWFYHFCQSHWRKIQELGHSVEYGNNPDFARSFRKFSALAFLPVYHIGRAFDILYEDLIEDDRFENFSTYFKNNYIGRRNRDGERGRPRFAIENWSQFTNVMDEISRTNNRVEGWNRRAKEIADCNHPHVFKLARIIIKDMENSDAILNQIKAGHEPEPGRKRYTGFNLRLKNLLVHANFSPDDSDEKILQLLNSIANIIKY